ncbi:MAG: peptidase M56 BlaR1, partial [Spirosomaceae bacterium]|nr:peptidase M56 BlaR1 [Spirosomataceae bacterium]
MLFLLKSSLVLAILTTAYAWLVKRETFLRVNRWLLWLNVAAALLLPVTPLPDWEWLPDAPSEVVANLVSSQPQVVGHQQDVGNDKQSGEGNKTVQIPQTVNHKRQTVNDKPQTVNHKHQTINVLTILYFVVVAGLAGRFLVQLVTLWRLRLRGTVYNTDEGLVLVASEAVKTPFSFFKWVFFNPAQHTPDEWAQVYAHERVHALQWHSADMVVAEIFKIVFWFNPFVWWHHRLVQETLEYLTDRAVLDSGIEKKSYQFHLLRSTLQTDTETFTNHFN